MKGLKRILFLLVCALYASHSLNAKGPERLFSSLQSTPNITSVYISEEALNAGLNIPDNSKGLLSLRGSELTSFEMVSATFDGKEKQAIVKLGNEIIDKYDFVLLSEVRKDFNNENTHIYYKPYNGCKGYASKIFIFQYTNNFGASLVYMTGKIDLKQLFGNGMGIGLRPQDIKWPNFSFDNLQMLIKG